MQRQKPIGASCQAPVGGVHGGGWRRTPYLTIPHAKYLQQTESDVLATAYTANDTSDLGRSDAMRALTLLGSVVRTKLLHLGPCFLHWLGERCVDMRGTPVSPAVSGGRLESLFCPLDRPVAVHVGVALSAHAGLCTLTHLVRARVHCGVSPPHAAPHGGHAAPRSRESTQGRISTDARQLLQSFLLTPLCLLW